VFSSVVPAMGVNANRLGMMPWSVHCWMVLIICFSVSPKPTIRWV